MFGGVSVPAASATDMPPPCAQIVRSISAGDVVRQQDLSPVPCNDQSLVALRFDRQAGGVRAGASLKPGQIVRRPPGFAMAPVQAGDTLYVRVRVGPVTVERTVQALQPARPGEPLFVRAGDGAVFSVPLSQVSP